MEILEFLLTFLKGLLIIAILLAVLSIAVIITLYILTSLVMSKHCKEKYGKSRVLVWIPIARLYYLGKEIYNVYLGVGLVVLRILFIFGDIGNAKILFLSASFVFKLVIYGMFIYLYSKYKDMKKLNTIKEAKIKKEK